MPFEPEVDSWYIVVTCAKCESILFLFRDLTDGQSSSGASYSVICPHCYHKGEYEARHYQHTQIS